MSQTLEAVFYHGDPMIRLDHTPSGADVANGEVVKIGNLAGICTTPEGIDDGAMGSVAINCVWKLLKDNTSGPTFSIGDVVCWDVSANLAIPLSSMGAGDFIVGICVEEDAGASDDHVKVLLNVMAAGGPAGLRIARGQHTTVAASDTVVTGLNTVVAVVASFDDAPIEAAKFISASIGDQAGTPAAGSILIRTHKDTDADAAIVDATTFGKKVNWIAIGT
jgi:hypothetical protein